jgi:hypothetical protein
VSKQLQLGSIRITCLDLRYCLETFRNRRETQDKYCIRGAEWGVGDCSAEGMSPEDREKFILMLKQKAGVK